MERPETCSQAWFEVMQLCWNRTPNARPQFRSLVSLITTIFEAHAEDKLRTAATSSNMSGWVEEDRALLNRDTSEHALVRLPPVATGRQQSAGRTRGRHPSSFSGTQPAATPTPPTSAPPLLTEAWSTGSGHRSEGGRGQSTAPITPFPDQNEPKTDAEDRFSAASLSEHRFPSMSHPNRDHSIDEYTAIGGGQRPARDMSIDE